MTENILKLNANETEFIMIGTHKQGNILIAYSLYIYFQRVYLSNNINTQSWNYFC